VPARDCDPSDDPVEVVEVGTIDISRCRSRFDHFVS
jgi:hypothetical protein